jgi:hypothetical protein
MLQSYVQEVTGLNLGQVTDILTEEFGDFHHSLQANTGMVP